MRSINDVLRDIVEWARQHSESVEDNSQDDERGTFKVVRLGDLQHHLNAMILEEGASGDLALPAPTQFGTRPAFNLGAMRKGSNRRNNHVGAAWVNDNGTLTVKLDPCVVLNGNDDDLQLKLFPANRTTDKKGASRDDETPF